MWVRKGKGMRFRWCTEAARRTEMRGVGDMCVRGKGMWTDGEAEKSELSRRFGKRERRRRETALVCGA
jgi:acyl-CoA synthetase (NDP forming)